MITENDIILAAGSQAQLLEVFGLGDTVDPNTDPDYAAMLAYALEEARAVLTEYLGITFSDGSVDSIPRADQLPLILLASRYAVLQAKLRGRGRLEDVGEPDELARLLDRLSAIARGSSWPGRARPDAQTKLQPSFVPRANLSPSGFFRR